MKLKTLRVEKYGPIKKATLDLDYTGLTFIFGLNKDAAQTGTTNGAGKSLLVSAIAEMTYDHHPADKTKAKSKEKSKLSLEFQKDDGTVIEFQKHYHPKKEFVVLKDGKNTKTRGLDYGHEKLRAILGEEEEFFSRMYIDGTRPHPMIGGKARDQQDFFVKLCHLQDVDATRQLLLKQLREVQKAAASYREVKISFDDLKATTIGAEELESLKARKVELEAQHEALMVKFQRDQKLRDLVAFYKDNRELITELKDLCSLDDFESTYEEHKAKRSRLKEQREVSLNWQAYKAQARQVEKKRKPLVEEIESLVGTLDEKTIVAKASKHEKAYELARDLTIEVRNLKDQLVEAKEVEKPEHELVACTVKVENLREQLEHAKEFSAGKCPTCGSKVEAHDPEDLRRQIKKWKARQEQAVAYSAYKQARKANVEIEEKLLVKKVELKDAQALVEKYTKWKTAGGILANLPEEPDRPEQESDKSVEDIDRRLEKLADKLQVFKTAAPVIEKIRQTQSLTKEQISKAKSGLDLGDKLSDLNVELANTTAKITLQTANRAQLNGLKTRGLVLKKQADDEPIIQSFIKAYSKTGYKKLRIQQYAEVFQAQLNKFASVFFSEQTEFELKYESKLVFTAVRQRGKTTKRIPVQRISGAEKSALTLALIAASISLQPKKNRLNVLILDEPDAHMGEVTREQFFKNIKLLNKVVPHIVIVTPKKVEIELEGARYFTMVKSNDVSKLVQGRVA